MYPTVDSTYPDRDQELELLDLTCPACDSDLIADELFLSHRVCGSCNRHFSIGARERISLLVDSGLFEELNSAFAPPESTLARDRFPSAERLAEHHQLGAVRRRPGDLGGQSSKVGVPVAPFDVVLNGGDLHPPIV